MLSILALSVALSADFHLPPNLPWNGKSAHLIQPSHPLVTEFELSEGQSSPDYSTTMAYLNKLATEHPDIFSIETIGTSDQNRDILMLRAAENPSVNKPTLLIQAGIHSGEIDGKDAGFMLLRDIATSSKRALLKKVNLLFIPILNVDGHERSSAYNRINQRGPAIMGFRSNSKNLNLNRDYTKLETPEVAALVKVVNHYKPDLYIDVHVTDGADYQYDVTYGYMPSFASDSPKISQVLDDYLKPEIDTALEEMGHIPGPLVFVMNKQNIKEGLAGWVATPRFSNGWGDLRNLPTILVENHSLKPYKQRVLGTYVFLEATINALAKHKKNLKTAVLTEQNQLPRQLVGRRTYSKNPDYLDFKGISFSQFDSSLTGQKEVKYTGKAETFKQLPIFWQKEPAVVLDVPRRFYIPSHYQDIVAKLTLQGVKVSQVSKPSTLSLTQFVISDYQFDPLPFEGRMRVSADFNQTSMTTEIDTSWFVVDADQALGKLATHLLHPSAVDSFFQWGFFNTVFQRTEYVENYALIPYATQMLADNPALNQEFKNKLANDAKFAASAKERAAWLYQQTPYYDQGYLKYPILFEY
ncbi:M14 family metallopeptidase [Pseudoalteromonas ulvae]|uniref:Peptidase M14 n=1 Tax=Pseudoalteromonas ulvae TaxID=107327 RepID=A0A244CMJ9_PSEDV|nr:M14 family metallopeptidase [Pseudoalteromonas ulvae]OUL56840.1 peptidase M14 [Pseudoalteromonas ulvae]